MRGTKRVAYVYVAEVCQLFGEVLTVLCLLFAAETGILEKHHVALVHSGNRRGRRISGHIIISYKIDRFSKLLRQSFGNRRQRLSLIGAVFHLAQMRAENYLSAVVDQLLNGGKRRFDSGLVRDLSIF